MRIDHTPSRLTAPIARHVAVLALRGLDPRVAVRPPVLMALELASLAATVMLLIKLANNRPAQAAFIGQVALWLWVALLAISAGMATVEAGALARSRRLRGLQSDIPAKSLIVPHAGPGDWLYETVSSETLDVGDVVLVEAGDIIPADGEVIAGVAEVNESAVTGESAPVIRESGGDRSAVVGGTTVLSDWLKIKVTADYGHSVFAQMSALIAMTRRRSGRTELWLTLPLLVLALLAVVAVVSARPPAAMASGLDLPVLLIALFGAILPTATAGLWSVTGIAGIGRLLAVNIVAKSGTAVEAAAGVDTLLLDKTGTITLGDRSVEAILPLAGLAERDVAEIAFLASLSDDTPEGRSIVSFAERHFGFGRSSGAIASALPFSAATRMSGATLADGTELLKGEPMAILRHLAVAAGRRLEAMIDQIARAGGTPLAVSRGSAVVGVVHLKDVVRPGMREQLAMLRRMGVRTIMVTGDNAKTAATVAAAAGVDAFVAEATPQAKLQLIRTEQAAGKRVGMCGDGTNDAPALAQADLGIALGHGAAAAREAANMIDFTSDPMTLLEVIRNCRRMAVARRSLTALTLGADLARYLVLLAAVFLAGSVSATDVGWFGTGSARSMLLAGCMFSALATLMLLPVAVRMPGVSQGWRMMVLYGLAGFVLAPIVIMLLQGAATALGLA